MRIVVSWILKEKSSHNINDLYKVSLQIHQIGLKRYPQAHNFTQKTYSTIKGTKNDKLYFKRLNLCAGKFVAVVF